jgi:hypothetical protein
MLVNGNRPTLQQGAKYGNVNTASLIIYNVDPSDGGHYICKADGVPSVVIVTEKDDPVNGHVIVVSLPDMASTEISLT